MSFAVQMVALALKKALYVTSTRIALMDLMKSTVVSYQSEENWLKSLHTNLIRLNATCILFAWWKGIHTQAVHIVIPCSKYKSEILCNICPETYAFQDTCHHQTGEHATEQCYHSDIAYC
jgi:hypothetical protein